MNNYKNNKMFMVIFINFSKIGEEFPLRDKCYITFCFCFDFDDNAQL